ncbi:MAG: hypothetical protein Tp1122DCM00d2C27307611_9 [Prokaryotic dsDNA virus sp.]|nr:MAG: hypothetical protein Tp1122DCM00d2C27307611_9 [Prokaryotic dsDNA virus sp.]|tara:strand:- start:7996 stop:8169 length:174 start_codon:yes stop_codon:yes gene_type:complete
MNKKIKAFLKDLGLDVNFYDGYFITDTKIVAKIDKTIIHIALNFKGYRAYALEREAV